MYLIEKPLAIATGCGFDVLSHHPVLIVDLGGGLIEIAIVSSGGIVVQKTLKNAGDHMNRLIFNYIHLKHGVILGEATCEELKIKLLDFTNHEKNMTVRGKSLESGLPKSVRVKSSDIREALLANMNQIIDAIKELLELSPPEIIDELLKKGIALSGSMAQVPGIADFIASEVKIDVYSVNQPADITINGLLKLSKNPKTIEQIRI